MLNKKSNTKSPWQWIPTLYFAEGIPYVIVMTVAVILYKRLGISNTDIALYTSWLYLPWVIKPLWSPLVDLVKTKRWWIVIMQLFIGAGLGGVALTLPLPGFFKASLAFFWLLAFSSATHDIAADGFYMLGLNEHKQAYFVGIRSTFYRFAMITGQGLLIILAGFLESATGLDPVEFTVSAHPGQAKTLEYPEKIEIKENPGKENYHFILSGNEIPVATQKMPVDEWNIIRQKVKDWNMAHGFIKNDRPIRVGEKQTLSWWEQTISDPLKKFLQKHFKHTSQNLKGDANQMVGNIAVVGMRLSHSPEKGESMVVNWNRARGDKSIRMVAGERLEFNSGNWNIPAWIMVQIDPKLQKQSKAVFSGRSGNIPLAWSITFIILAGMFLVFCFYHKLMLPRPASDTSSGTESSNMLHEFLETFASFFRKKEIGIILAFLLLYRLGESQLVKLASPFLLDTREVGGLGLTTGEVGMVYGTIGILFLTLGGLLGGWVASRNGLKYWLWWMVIAINLPNLVYVYLSLAAPESFAIISACVAVEQFGYGFGFTAYMLYMIYISEGKNKTAHFAIATGFMALGMMIPGMVSGWIQDIVGYQNFFIWVMLCTFPGFLIIKFIKIDPEFGIKK